jgi:hypothetical protein
MKKEIKEICKQQEQDLISAVECNYKRGTTQKQIDDMIKVYQYAFKREWKDNRSCSICILKLYKQVGEWYKVQVGLEPKKKGADKQTLNNKE